MRRLACALALLALAACAPKKDDPPATLQRVEVTPPAPQIPQGASAQLQATAVYSDGRTADVTEQASWSSSAPGVVQVSDAAGTKGLAAAVAAGPATISASYRGVSGAASATGVVLAIVSIEVTPASPSLPKGQDLQLTATATYEGGARYDVTAAATWTSGAPGTASVSDAAGTKGRVHAVAEGSATVGAALGGTSGSTAVTVTPATLASVRVSALRADLPVGTATSLTATAVFSDGTELDVTGAADWSATPAGVLEVARLAGAATATAVAPGVATVTATYQLVPGSLTVTARAAVLTSISIAPATPSTVVGGTVSLRANGTYSGGEVVDVTALATWSSASPLVAVVSNAAGTKGTVTGLATGGAQVTAAFGGATGSVTVQVTALVPAAIRIEPDAATVSPGRSLALRAFGRDAGGAEVELTGVVTWQSNAAGIATVSTGGVLSGVALGTAVVTASYSGKVGTAQVMVETPYPIALAVRPDPETSTSASVGAAGGLRAQALYSDWTLRDVTEAAAWGSDAPGVVSVSSAPGSKGDVVAVGPGVANVGAAFAGLSAQVTFAIAPRAVEWLVVSVPPSPLPVSVTHGLRATAVYRDYTTEDVTAVATWTASGGAATVDAAGVVTTAAEGNAVVTATYGGVSSSTLVIVTGDRPVGLQFTLGSTTVAQGDYAWWTATLVYASSARYAVNDGVQLVSRDPAVADVVGVWTGMPVPRGLQPGTATIEARYAGLGATAVLTVTAATGVSVVLPAQLALGATVLAGFEGAMGRADLADEATWTSSNPSVLTVTSGGPAYTNGWVSAVGLGTATITATFGTVTASRAVTVRPRAMTVTVSPAFAEIPDALATGGPGSQQFTATANLSDGTTIDVTAVARWTSSWDVAAPDFTPGLIYAMNPGRTLVTASYGGAAGSALLTVSAGQPSRVAISPETMGTYRFPKGVTVKLKVYARLPWGDYRSPSSGVTWTSSNPAAAAFSTDPAHEGELTTTAAGGTTTITASYLGVADPYPRTVVVDDPIGILPPAPVTVPVAGRQTVPVQAMFPNAAFPSSPYSFDLAPWATWTSLDPAVAVGRALDYGFAYGGEVAGVTPGSTTVTVAFGTWSSPVPVTVTVPGVTGFAIALPDGTTLGAGTRAPLTATATLSNADKVDVANAVAGWTTTDATIAEVTGTPPGVDAKTPGPATIGATFAGLGTTVALSVTDQQLAPLVFVPSVVSVSVGGAAVTYLQPPSSPASNAHVGAEAVVSSSDPAVALVTNDRYGVRVQGLSPGSAVVTATYRGRTYQALANVYAAPGHLEATDGTMAWNGTRTVLHPSGRATLYAFASGPKPYDSMFADDFAAPGATWTTSDPAIVRIVSPGVVEGVAPGVAEVTASLGGTSSRTWVIVSGATLTGLARSKQAFALPVGAEAAVHTYAIYTDGSELVDHVAAWSSTSPAIVELVPGQNGAIRAKAPGIAYVEARFGGFTARTPVTVFQP